MIYAAFTLGLFGSLHCLGMCGPLAIAFSNKEGNSKYENVKSSLYYNIGRTFTYAFLGLLFGTLGSFIFVADLQKSTSILLGIMLIFTFLFSIDLDKFISKNQLVSKFYFRIRSMISNMINKSKQFHPFQLGMANGLLPCGLVYLALAGALASGSILGGISFMSAFGLGTIPMLFVLTTGIGMFPMSYRSKYRKLLPYVTLSFGLFLIYRGVVIDMPVGLNFWEAIKNPILCH